jgi:addiction module RelB/DinJ family antitoxin
MNPTTIHIKTDVKTRDSAKKVAEDFGFTLTSLVNAMLKQVARTKRLTLSLEESPNQSAIDALKQSEEDVKAGRVRSFHSGQEAVSYVRSLIKDDKYKKHKHS